MNFKRAISGENGLTNHLKKEKKKEKESERNLFYVKIYSFKWVKKTALTVLVQYLQSIGLEIQQSDWLIFYY